MLVNGDNFQLIHYEGSEDIKTSTENWTQVSKKDANDLGIIKSDNITFSEHKNATAVSSQMVGWILRTFKTREAKPKIKLSRTLMLSRLEYYYVLRLSFMMGETENLEKMCTVKNYTIRYD